MSGSDRETGVWDGVTRWKALADREFAIRRGLADCARDYDWDGVLRILAEHPRLANVSRPGGTSWYAPLHHAAHGGAPSEIVVRLIELGAWRSLVDAHGERPVDIAGRRGHADLLDPLQPRPSIAVPDGVLVGLQNEFHTVIRGRVGRLVEEQALRLPELVVLLEVGGGPLWFSVPGMFGGFKFWLQGTGEDACLVSESWCRVAGGSGQRHLITSDGSSLVEEGFV